MPKASKTHDVKRIAAYYGLPIPVIQWRLEHRWPTHLLGEKTIPYSSDRPVQVKPGSLTLRGVVK